MKLKYLKKIKPRTWLALVIFVILLPLVVVSLYHAKPSEAAWFNDTFSYRKKYSFTHNAALTNNRIDITVDTATLTTEKMRADCNDTRFTDLNGKILKYQEVSGCDSASTVYDIVFPTIINGTNEFYFYYGNPGAVDTSQDVSSFTDPGAPSGGAPSAGSEEKGIAPILYWDFDQGVSNTCPSSNDVCDGSNSANHGDIDGSTSLPLWQSEDKCISSKCMYFTGTSAANGSRVRTTSFPNLATQTTGTISYWAKATLTNTSQNLFSFSRNADGTTTYLTMDYDNSVTNNIRGSVNLDNTAQWAFNTTASDFNPQNETNKWHLYTMTHNATTPALFIDGRSIPITFSVTTNKTKWFKAILTDASSKADSFTIAQYRGNNTVFSPFKGYFDEFKIYGALKSNAEVASEYIARGGSDGTAARFGGTENKFLSDGLVGYWDMDDNDIDSHSCVGGGTIAGVCDKSGNGVHATANGTMTDSDFLGEKFGYAVDLDGTNDYLQKDDLSANLIGGGMTVAGWVLPPNNPADHSFYFGFRNDTTFDIYATQLISSNNLECRFRNSAGTNFDAGTVTVTPNVWNHVAIVFTGNSVTCFVNGVPGNSTNTTGTVSSTTEEFSIGARAGSGNSPANADFDEVRVYNRGLSVSEINSLYNWAPGPVGYWKLDEGRGNSTVNDSSGNSLASSMTAMETTDWVQGRFGKALEFDGSAEYISVTDTAILRPNSSSLTVSAWANPADTNQNGAIAAKTQGTSDFEEYSLQICGADDCSTSGQRLAGSLIEQSGSIQRMCSTTADVADGKWHHYTSVADKVADTIFLYVDGVIQAKTCTTTGVWPTVNNTDNFRIASYQSGGFYGGKVDEVRVYNYPRTAQQIVEDMNGGHPAGGSPVGSQVANWKLNETTGQTINNSAPTALTAVRGTTSGSEAQDFTWKTKEVCKSNSCGDFDGSDDVITVTNTAAIDFNDNLVNGFTFGMWVNPDTVGEGSAGQIFSKTSTTNCALGGSTPFNITCSVDLGTDATVTVNAVIPTATWTFVAVSYTDDSDDEITIWINGAPRGTSTNGVGPTSADTANLLIGNNSAGSATFDGKIDEFQIYSSELSADQMKLIANFGGVLNAGTGTAENSLIQGGAGNPPVALWSLDDKIGVAPVDKSGSGLVSSFIGSPGPVWSNSCKIGGCLYSDQADDNSYMNVTNNAVLQIASSHTIEAWVKPNDTSTDATTGDIIVTKLNSNLGYQITWDYNGGSSRIGFGLGDSSATSTTWSSTNKVNGNWYHVAGVFDGTNARIYINGVLENTAADAYSANTGDDVRILGGYSGAKRLKGSIDEIKIYNYARSQAQVAYDYNRGGPVGWWKMNECNGTIIHDSSGNGKSGTWSGAGGSQTSAGTCSTASTAWGNGAVGKFNSSLYFDGSDDIVSGSDASLPSGTNPRTISAWVNPVSLPSSGNQSLIFYYGSDSTDGANGLQLANVSGTQNIRYMGWFDDYDVPYTVPTSSWTHIVGTHDTSTTKLYVNGELIGSSAAFSAWNTVLGQFDMAIHNAGAKLTGQLDDIRVYNYVLSPTQIKKLYNDNSGVRFGPSTGTP